VNNGICFFGALLGSVAVLGSVASSQSPSLPGCGCVAPAPAKAAGFNVETLGGPPSTANGWVQNDPDAVLTTNADGSITIHGIGGPNNYNDQIGTAQPGTDGNFSGAVFGGGGYFEATLAIAGAKITTDNGWPAFWSNDIEMQSAWVEALGGFYSPLVQWWKQPAGYDNWIEPDFMEVWGLDNYGGAIHHWYGQLPNNFSDVNAGYYNSNPFYLPPGTDISKPHKYGFLWVPATPTKRGRAAWYFDGKQVGTTVYWHQYHPSNPPPPVVGSSAWSVMDVRHLYVMLGSSPDNPITVWNVGVWQRSDTYDLGVAPFRHCRSRE
jgi:hypothetical protein